VLVEGYASPPSEALAIRELKKVLLRYACPAARIVVTSGAEEVPTEEEAAHPHRVQKNLTSCARFIARCDPDSQHTLKINMDSSSPTLLQFYEAAKKDDPVDKYMSLFKIIEYLSGVKKDSELDTIRSHLQKDWWIPDDVRVRLDELMKRSILPTKHRRFFDDPPSYLYQLRGIAHHMRPEYGLTPLDEDSIAELAEANVILQEIVKHTLERHPDTKA